MREFAILPWEYVGASFDPRSHTRARLEIGAKKRNFSLKMRDGIIYFKEPLRPQIFAILRIFDNTLATDTDRRGLIAAFQKEVREGNYGALLVRHEAFTHSVVSSQIILLVRPDGTGWMREHFDTQWFPLPHWGKPLAMNLWGNNLNTQISLHILPAIKDVLLQRTIELDTLQAEPIQWVGGTEDEFCSLFISATRVFLSPTNFTPHGTQLVLNVKSHSSFAAGENSYWHRFYTGDLRNSRYRKEHISVNHLAVLELIEKQFHFVGVDWIEVRKHIAPRLRPQDKKLFNEGLKRWGENWRGNWAPQQGSFELALPDLKAQSTHEKLESSLLLRQWLKDKMPAPQIDGLFQSIDLS